MQADTIIKRYLKALEESDHDAMMDLFVDQAYIDSPLYGIQPADSFFRDLFGNTVQSKIRLVGCFTNLDRPGQAIGYFSYYWRLKDGSRAIFDCVDIFELDLETSKIRALKIIYDTFHAPPSARQSAPPPPPSVQPTSGATIPKPSSTASLMSLGAHLPQSSPAAVPPPPPANTPATMPPPAVIPPPPPAASASPTLPPGAAIPPPPPAASAPPTLPPGAGPSVDEDARPTLPPGAPLPS